MERTLAHVFICAKDFSDQMDVSPDELAPLRGERSSCGLRAAPQSFCHGKLDIAGARPLYLQRQLGILKRLITYVFSRSVIDLSSGPLNNAEHQHNAAGSLQLMTHQSHTMEVPTLTLAWGQKPPVTDVASVAGSRLAKGKLKVLTARGQFIEGDVEVEVFFVGDELEPSGKKSADLRSTGKRVAQEDKPVARIQIFAEDASRHHAVYVTAISEVNGLRN
jgi:hypothetical protein